MPDRAIPPLIAGVTFGFITGLIAAVLQLDEGPTIALALVCGVLAALAGLGSTLTADAPRDDKVKVALLRAALGGLLAILLVFAMTRFLRDGDIVLGMLLLLIAGFVALPLAQMRVREPRSD